MRKLLAVMSALVLATAILLVAPLGATADVPATVSDYTSYGYATGIHVIGATSAFNNFKTGAADSHFPLAKVGQDSSPSAYGTSTYNDSGPIGATLHGCADPNGQTCPPVPAVPYAHAQFPGGPADSHIDSCSTPPPGAQQNTPCPPKDASGNQPAPSRADAHAEELKSDASGYYAGGNAGVPGSGASGESHTVVNPDGTLVVSTRSFVNNATFGTPPNAVVINKVLVETRVTIAGGVATADAKVSVGSATVNGQPIQLSDQGATYQEQTVSCVPGSAPPAPAPPPALPGGVTPPAPPATCSVVVETDTFKVYTVAPVKTVNGNHGTVKASGVHVVATHPAPTGVPQQSVEYVLGEGYADATANPGSGSSVAGLTSGDFGLGGMDFASGDFGAGGETGAAGGAGGAGPHKARGVASVLAANRQPLALLFLFWECLVLGAAAAWVWARRRPVPEELEVEA
jgi:hypothetical protein